MNHGSYIQNQKGFSTIVFSLGLSLLISSKVLYDFSKIHFSNFTLNNQNQIKTTKLFLHEELNKAFLSINDTNAWTNTISNNASYSCFSSPCTPGGAETLIKIYDSANNNLIDTNGSAGLSTNHKPCTTWTQSANSTNCIYKLQASIKSFCLDGSPCSNQKHILKVWVEMSEGYAHLNLNTFSFQVFR